MIVQQNFGYIILKFCTYSCSVTCPFQRNLSLLALDFRLLILGLEPISLPHLLILNIAIVKLSSIFKKDDVQPGIDKRRQIIHTVSITSKKPSGEMGSEPAEAIDLVIDGSEEYMVDAA